ncbi:MAG TPA: leucine-rich repeat domain-containing protein [Phycisphaerae bacterium]|nr:leucine-rich repeat domain-containing protein [Phycisphaerae bacterium]
MAKHKISLVVMALVGVPFFLASCKGTEPGAGAAGDELRVVKVEGAAVCYNHTLAPFSWMVSEEGRPAGLLARDGDLLAFLIATSPKKTPGDPLFLSYRATDGAALAVALEDEDERLLLAGKTVSVLLKDEATWEWLGQASEEDLKGLRLLYMEETVDAAQFEILKKVAKTNPAIDLWLEPREAPPTGEEGAAAPPAVEPADALRLFRPRLLSIPAATLAAETEQVRTSLEDVEVLMLGNAEGESLDFLAHLPRLRTLLLSKWSPEQSPLPKKMKSLKSLILGKSPSGLSPLADFPQLEQLTLTGDNAEDLSPLAKLPKLHILSLAGCEKVTDLGPLKNLPLEYLSFPPKISQQEFDAVIKDHSGLKAVELFNCENVKDIAALKGLKDLKALVLIKPAFEGEKHLADLKELKGLRLLVLPPWEGEEANAKIAELQKALPDCLITAGKPLCLGSGWILLLAPVVAGAWLISRRRAR